MISCPFEKSSVLAFSQDFHKRLFFLALSYHGKEGCISAIAEVFYETQPALRRDSSFCFFSGPFSRITEPRASAAQPHASRQGTKRRLHAGRHASRNGYGCLARSENRRRFTHYYAPCGPAESSSQHLPYENAAASRSRLVHSDDRLASLLPSQNRRCFRQSRSRHSSSPRRFLE